MSLLGILVPMYEEIELLLQNMALHKTHTSGGRQYHEGLLWGKPCVVVMSGIGKVSAAVAATVLAEKFKVSAILVTGTAGGVGQNVHVGDICVASECLQHDMDTSPIFPRFEIPLTGISAFAIDKNWVGICEGAAAFFLQNELKDHLSDEILSRFYIHSPKVHTGLLASGDKFMNDPQLLGDLKRALPTLTFIEMEGAAVAQVCHSYNLPSIHIRTVSDNANDAAHVDFKEYLYQVAKYYTLGIIQQVINRL